MLEENNIIIGNVYDKYATKNYFEKILINNFLNKIFKFIDKTKCDTIHELGCGEGHLINAIHNEIPNIFLKASDFSNKIIQIASANYPGIEFNIKDIYNLDKNDTACLLLCSEVLEHLENPFLALKAISNITSHYALFSVPREPMWRILNVLRGKYLNRLGNTPGHIQHWNKKTLINAISKYFNIIDVSLPIPWIIVLCRSKKIK